MGKKKTEKKGKGKTKAVSKTAAKKVLKRPDPKLRVAPKASDTMVNATERYITEVGKTTSELTKHRGSKTIESQDVHLATRLTLKERYQSKKMEYTMAKNDKARMKAVKKREEKKKKEKLRLEREKNKKSVKKRLKGMKQEPKAPAFKHIDPIPENIPLPERNKAWKKIKKSHEKNDPLYSEIAKKYRSDVQGLDRSFAAISEIAGVTANASEINTEIEAYNKEVDSLNKSLKYYNIPKDFNKPKTREKREKRKKGKEKEPKTQKQKEIQKLREEQRKIKDDMDSDTRGRFEYVLEQNDTFTAGNIIYNVKRDKFVNSTIDKFAKSEDEKQHPLADMLYIFKKNHMLDNQDIKKEMKKLYPDMSEEEVKQHTKTLVDKKILEEKPLGNNRRYFVNVQN